MKSSNNTVKALSGLNDTSEFLNELRFWGPASEFRKAITELLFSFSQSKEDLGDEGRADVIYYTRGINHFIDQLEKYQIQNNL